MEEADVDEEAPLMAGSASTAAVPARHVKGRGVAGSGANGGVGSGSGASGRRAVAGVSTRAVAAVGVLPQLPAASSVIGLRRLLQEALPQWRRLLIGALCLVGTTVGGLITPSLFGAIIDATTQPVIQLAEVRRTCFLLTGTSRGARCRMRRCDDVPCVGVVLTPPLLSRPLQ
jgi:hypothetical protein